MRLIVLFAVGVVAIVALVDVLLYLYFTAGGTGNGSTSSSTDLTEVLVGATVVTVAVIGFGSAVKVLALRGGGYTVARALGATYVDRSSTDPRLRRFVNVVEEMSIASGVPVPQLFVLEQEGAINAFAAGYTPADAAITVTAGALDTLNRDELQGVIAHEFSHVLNGDMRINIRLIGLLYGIMLLSILGVRIIAYVGWRGRKSNPIAGLVIGFSAVAFIVVGYVGQFFAGLIKAAVSRQREWLADASAVQFTRQSAGLAGALKKIAGIPEGSTLRDKAGEKQVSHMLFGEGRRGFSQLFATHPPLLERIAALEPGFDAAQAAWLQQQYGHQHPDGAAEDVAMGLSARTPTPAMPATSPPVTLTPQTVVERVGTLTSEDLSRGAALSSAIPPDYRRLAGQRGTAVPLVLALLVDRRPDVASRQLDALVARLGSGPAGTVEDLYLHLPPLRPELRLPVVSLAVGQLGDRPPGERAALLAAVDELARADGVVDVFEYCLSRLVGAYLRDAAHPSARSRRASSSTVQMDSAALSLLAAVSAAGNASRPAAEHAFHAAVAHLLPGRQVPYVPPATPWQTLDAGWPLLRGLAPRNTQLLVEALVIGISDDGVVTASEAELLRTSCALLGAPLPPLVA